MHPGNVASIGVTPWIAFILGRPGADPQAKGWYSFCEAGLI
jgi:hypothetical protein